MANFFDEERIKCECGTELYEEVDTYMLIKDGKKIYKSPYKKFHKCIGCGQLSDIKEAK